MRPIISRNIRLRHPDHFIVGADSIVDDFCYFSTKVRVGRCSHIASGCSVAGGVARQFTMGDGCSISSGVKIWCVSDDFTRDLVAILPSELDDVKKHLIAGDVTLKNYSAVGSNSVVMPDNIIPEGTVIGALSFVPASFKLKPWSVYAGTPIRYLRRRDRKSVSGQVERLRAYLSERLKDE